MEKMMQKDQERKMMIAYRVCPAILLRFTLYGSPGKNNWIKDMMATVTKGERGAFIILRQVNGRVN